jgi:hypothetical protein
VWSWFDFQPIFRDIIFRVYISRFLINKI